MYIAAWVFEDIESPHFFLNTSEGFDGVFLVHDSAKHDSQIPVLELVKCQILSMCVFRNFVEISTYAPTGLCMELVEIHNDRIFLELTCDCLRPPNGTPRTDSPG